MAPAGGDDSYSEDVGEGWWSTFWESPYTIMDDDEASNKSIKAKPRKAKVAQEPKAHLNRSSSFLGSIFADTVERNGTSKSRKIKSFGSDEGVVGMALSFSEERDDLPMPITRSKPRRMPLWPMPKEKVIAEDDADRESIASFWDQPYVVEPPRPDNCEDNGEAKRKSCLPVWRRARLADKNADEVEKVFKIEKTSRASEDGCESRHTRLFRTKEKAPTAYRAEQSSIAEFLDQPYQYQTQYDGDTIAAYSYVRQEQSHIRDRSHQNFPKERPKYRDWGSDDGSSSAGSFEMHYGACAEMDSYSESRESLRDRLMCRNAAYSYDEDDYSSIVSYWDWDQRSDWGSRRGH